MRNSHIIKQTMVLLNKFVEHQGTPHFNLGESLTLTELHMLHAIEANPHDNITELAAKMGCTKGRVSKIVAKLCNKSLVAKYKDAGNDKDVLLQLTQKGQRINQYHQEADKKLLAKLEVFLDQLSPEQRKAVYDYLKIAESMFNH
jgi:DNA-binding MarR family transcriptional regulator